MKKILFRKLLIDYLSFFLIALLGSSIVVWVFQAVNYLDIMIEDGRDYTIYINYSLLNFPKILSKLLPFVLFFSKSEIYENSLVEMYFFNPPILNFSSTNKMKFEEAFIELLVL